MLSEPVAFAEEDFDGSLACVLEGAGAAELEGSAGFGVAEELLGAGAADELGLGAAELLGAGVADELGAGVLEFEGSAGFGASELLGVGAGVLEGGVVQWSFLFFSKNLQKSRSNRIINTRLLFIFHCQLLLFCYICLIFDIYVVFAEPFERKFQVS